jgi:hypothetical protein
MEEQMIWIVYGVCAGIVFLFYLRRKRKIRAILAGSVSGLLALLLLHYGGELIGFAPALNSLSLVQSLVLGVPGVILLFVLHILV